MAKVPTYDYSGSLQPTPLDPKIASSKGRSISELAGGSASFSGIQGIGEQIQKLDDQRQTLKAQTQLAQSSRQNYEMAATDSNIDNLSERINAKSTQDIQNASELIQSPSARNDFIAQAGLDTERRNLPAYKLVLNRKSQDYKTSLVTANDEDIKTYQSLADPTERQILRQQVVDRTDKAISDGHVNPQWAKTHVETALKQADLDQVKNDMAINAEATYEALQKGKEGLYPEISDKARKEFSDKAEKLMAKQGSENRLIFGIAQNQSENQLIDLMGQNKLTQDIINQAQMTGLNGIRIRPQFAKAATESLQDPFPTDPVPEKYNKLVNDVTDPDKDLIETKLEVLKTRGVTPQQKAHLLNTAMREDPVEGKQSLNKLIQSGIQKNKQEIMEANNKLQKEITDRKSFLRGVFGRFRDHAKDEKHLADLQQDYFDKTQKAKDQNDMMSMANDVLNRDTLNRNPNISTSDSKGTLHINKITNAKRMYFPDGHWEPVK